MSSYAQWKQRACSWWESLTQQHVLKGAGVGAFMLAAFLGFRFYNRLRGPAVLRIQEIKDCIERALDRAQASRSSLLLEQSHTTEARDVTMQFLLVSKLGQKERENNELVRNPFLPPFEEGLFVKQLGPSHRLLFNKFNLYQQHLLVVTREFEPQSNPLTRDDLKHAILAFRAVKGFYFYNSGPTAGASQTHKHIQIFPSEAKDLPMFRSILEYCRELKYEQLQREQHNPEELAVHHFPPFNFRHGLVLLGNLQESLSENDKMKGRNGRGKDETILKLKENTVKAYEKLYKSVIGPREGEEVDYNLIGCEHFLIMIPRRKEKAFNDLSVNAIGFMGSVLFKDPNLLRKYINESRQGYQILEDITFPRKE